MTFPPVALQVILLLIVCLAAIYDLRYRRIPNWLVLIGLLLGLGVNAFLFEWARLQRSLLGVGIALLVYFPLSSSSWQPWALSLAGRIGSASSFSPRLWVA
jgi:prepilin peptidase CpaA